MFKFGDKVSYSTESDEYFFEKHWHNGIVEEVVVMITLPNGRRKQIPISKVTVGWKRKGVME